MPRTKRVPDTAIETLAEPMRRRIYELVSSAEAAIGRDAVAAGLAIGRPLATFHLERLVAAGLLAPEYRRLTGRSGPGAGRPSKLYRRSALAIELTIPPRRYFVAAELFAETLAAASAEAGAATPSERVLMVATHRGAAAGRLAAMAPDSAGWVEALAEAGYEPLLDAPVGRVRLRNCPYADLARDHQGLMCPANQAFLEGFAGAFERTEAAVLRLDRPDGGCCVTFEPAIANDQPAVSQTR